MHLALLHLLVTIRYKTKSERKRKDRDVEFDLNQITAPQDVFQLQVNDSNIKQ